jgi:CTP:molybdopterin cytidylyltransferase MocA
VLPCDQYRITPDDLRMLHRRWRLAPSIACISVSDGYAGPPAILPDEYFERLLRLRGDAGARAVLRDPTTRHEIVNPHAAFDLDSPADLLVAHAWHSAW